MQIRRPPTKEEAIIFVQIGRTWRQLCLYHCPDWTEKGAAMVALSIVHDGRRRGLPWLPLSSSKSEERRAAKVASPFFQTRTKEEAALAAPSSSRQEEGVNNHDYLHLHPDQTKAALAIPSLSI